MVRAEHWWRAPRANVSKVVDGAMGAPPTAVVEIDRALSANGFPCDPCVSCLLWHGRVLPSGAGGKTFGRQRHAPGECRRVAVLCGRVCSFVVIRGPSQHLATGRLQQLASCGAAVGQRGSGRENKAAVCGAR